MRASRATVGPRSSGEVARQHASARSNQRFVNSFLCLNLFFAERQSYVHICGFNVDAHLPSEGAPSEGNGAASGSASSTAFSFSLHASVEACGSNP